MKTGIEQIADERQRQIDAEGWTPAHDDEHAQGELSDAAACYALGKRLPVWPWSTDWWKPGEAEIGGRVRDLVNAGALIAAEIDRINRLPSNTGIGGNVQRNND